MVKIAVERNLNKQSGTQPMLSLSVQTQMKQSVPKKMAHLLNPAGEDFQPSVTLSRWAAPLSQVSLHTTHVHKFRSWNRSAPLRWGFGALLSSSRLSALLLPLLLLSLCAAVDVGSAHSRRHLVMTPTDREADDCGHCGEGKELSSNCWKKLWKCPSPSPSSSQPWAWLLAKHNRYEDCKHMFSPFQPS